MQVAKLTPGARESPLVLLVESHDDSRDMYSMFLLACGLRVAAASDAREALERLDACKPDLVITELDLSGEIDGGEFCARVKAQRNPPPVIVLTAWTTERYLYSARAAGCDRLLVKPCLPNALLAEIRVLVQIPQEQPI